MEITEATAHAIDDLLEIADGARRTMELAQIRIAAILGVDDENTWVADAVAGGSDRDKMLAMTGAIYASKPNATDEYFDAISDVVEAHPITLGVKRSSKE